jgi:hypothetical protein
MRVSVTSVPAPQSILDSAVNQPRGIDRMTGCPSTTCQHIHVSLREDCLQFWYCRPVLSAVTQCCKRNVLSIPHWIASGLACLLPMPAAITPCPTKGTCSRASGSYIITNTQCLLNVCIPDPQFSASNAEVPTGVPLGMVCGELHYHMRALFPAVAWPVAFYVVQQTWRSGGCPACP